MENRRGIQAAIYNSNLKRYIFNQYDHALAENNSKGVSNDGEIASCSRAITDVPRVVLNRVKVEPASRFNNTNTLEISDESIEQDLPQNLPQQYHQINPFFDDDFLGDVNHVADDDSGDLMPNISAEEDENASEPQIKQEQKINFLNLPDELLDISDDEFDALRDEIAYGNGEDSFEELRNEFDNLIKNGIKLPAAIKEEPAEEKSVVHLNVVAENNVLSGELSVALNEVVENDGAPSAHDRLRLEYAKCKLVNACDPVLGNLVRFENVGQL